MDRSSSRLPFIYTYNDLSPNISRILNNHWSVLKNSFPEVEEFKAPPLMSYRRTRNVKDLLVKSEVRKDMGSVQTYICPPKMGCFPCLGCVNCKLIKKGSSIQHPNTGKIMNIRHFLTCNSEWVVYLLWCPCSLYYVGETTCMLKMRLNGHRQSIRKKTC